MASDVILMEYRFDGFMPLAGKSCPLPTYTEYQGSDFVTLLKLTMLLDTLAYPLCLYYVYVDLRREASFSCH